MAEKTVRIQGAPTEAPPTALGAPLTADILAGSRSSTGALIAIPANRIWYGFFTASATIVGTGRDMHLSLVNAGGIAVPVDTVELLSLDLATGTAIDSNVGSVCTHFMYIKAGNIIPSEIILDTTGSPYTFSATAYGYLLA